MENSITLIGTSGAGKKTYLACVSAIMALGKKHISLTLKGEENSYLREIWEQMKFGRLPFPTDKIENYSFAVNDDYRKIFDFNLTNCSFTFMNDLSASTAKILNSSECLLFFIDAREFLISECNEKIDRQRYVDLLYKKNQSFRFIYKIMRHIYEERELPPIGIVITKCDLIHAAYAEYVMDAIESLFVSRFEVPSLVVPISISLGDNIESGRIDPFNVEQPIAFAMLSIIVKLLAITKQIKSEKEQYIVDNSGFFQKAKLSSAKQTLIKVDSLIDLYTRCAIDIVDLFPDDKELFLNGSRQNLKEYFLSAIKTLVD